jgi:hypothetical protein
MMFIDMHFRISNFYVPHTAELKENHPTYCIAELKENHPTYYINHPTYYINHPTYYINH